MVAVLSGTARVVCNGRRIATVRTGDAVGEMSLIDGHRTSASVVADTAVDALELHRTAFQELLDDTPAISKKLLLAQTALEPRRYQSRLRTVRMPATNSS